MAFTGTPTVVQVSDRRVRITGLTLVASAVGTIGLTGATGTPPDVTLPATFHAFVYSYGGVTVPLQSSIEVTVNPDEAGLIQTNLPLSQVKSGTTEADFRITLTNTNTGATTQGLEIYVDFATGRVAQPANVMGIPA
ncbi:MAG: hypothetical protein WA418_07900 [Bradyrhizobium sp.]